MRQYFNVLEKTYKQLAGTMDNEEMAVVNYNGDFINKICIDDSGLFLVLHHITDSDYSKCSIINDMFISDISIYVHKKSYLHRINITNYDSSIYCCKFSES